VRRQDDIVEAEQLVVGAAGVENTRPEIKEISNAKSIKFFKFYKFYI